MFSSEWCLYNIQLKAAVCFGPTEPLGRLQTVMDQYVNMLFKFTWGKQNKVENRVHAENHSNKQALIWQQSKQIKWWMQNSQTGSMHCIVGWIGEMGNRPVRGQRPSNDRNGRKGITEQEWVAVNVRTWRDEAVGEWRVVGWTCQNLPFIKYNICTDVWHSRLCKWKSDTHPVMPSLHYIFLPIFHSLTNFGAC